MVDGALAVKPRTRAVPSVRNTSASSMQSPPASADATSVIILSSGLARPGASPGAGPKWGKDQLGISHQAVIVEGDVDAVGMVAW